MMGFNQQSNRFQIRIIFGFFLIYLPHNKHMSITLYYHPLSQPSRSVLALLNIGKFKFDEKIVDLMKGETRSADYLKINPYGGVPFLIHNDIQLS